MEKRIMNQIRWSCLGAVFLFLWMFALPAFAAATATTTTLASATNPSRVGATTVLTATVVGTAAPTGIVTFKDGATILGTKNLSGTGNTKTATYTATFTTVAIRSLTAVYGGDASNLTSTSTAISQTVTQATTTATVTSSVNPTVYGGATTLTGTLTGGYVPTGTITFKDGVNIIGSAAVTSNKATLSVANLPVGVRSITASYSGDANNTASLSSALTQTINIKATTTTLSATPTPSSFGNVVTLTATVAGSTPTGTVTFKDGTTVIGTATVSAVTANKAVLPINSLAVGTHSLTAVYNGDAGNAASTSAAKSQVVNIKATTTVVTSSLNPSNPGNSVTLTATVTGSTPTGSVIFKDGAATLGTGTLNGAGAATYTTSTLSTASHSITAVYSGDVGNATSTSSAFSQLITTKSLATVTLSSVPATSTYGQNVVLTTTVAGTGTTPTGTITFKSGTSTIGSTALNAGVATFATSTLPAGTHSLTAVYGGNTIFANGTSNVLPQLVNKGVATITLQTSVNPVVNNAYASFTALVTSAAGLPVAGNVIFKNGATVLGSVPITSNVAIGSYSFPVGLHRITASYAGDANYDPSGDSNVIVQVSTNNINQIYQYGYDALGKPNTMVDPLSQTTNFYVDSLGRQIQIQQPPQTAEQTQPTTTSFKYDSGDSLIRVTDPRNLATNYTPDGLGQVKTLVSPDTGLSSFTYDAQGNILSKTDARGKITSMTYDVLDRVTSVTYPTGIATVFEYDGGNNPTAANSGELTKITDESGSQTYTYDSAGRLTSKTQVTNARTFVVTYAWGNTGSATDKLTSITYPSGSRVNYTYGMNGQIQTITLDSVGSNGTGFGGNQSLLSAVNLNSYGVVTGWIWGNGLQNPKAYYMNGDMFAYELGFSAGTGNAAGTSRMLARDDASQIAGFIHTRAGVSISNLDQNFTYDNLGRVLTGTLGGVTTQYDYDATGNRTSKVVGSTTYVNTIGVNSNRLTQTQDIGGTVSITHDAAGNITGDGVNTYTYSDRGRMASAVSTGGVVSYSYNALDQRVSKIGPIGIVSTGAAYYVYDESGNLLGEYSATGTPLYETIYLGSNLAAMPVGVMKQTGAAAQNNIATSLYNVYADHINTPRVITRPSDNAIVWRWDAAEAFGATPPDQNPSALGTFVYNQRFPGQVFDAETGLNQNWNRDYDPRQGRYRQSDPIGLAGGINTYSYVEGNPLSYTDPMGLQAGTLGRLGLMGGFAIGGPPGAVVGGLLGVGGGLLLGYGLDRMFNRPSKTPNDGEPGSCHVNPGSGQERKFGNNGRPEYDIDWDHDHGQGSPHGHNWDGNSRDSGWPISPWPRGRTSGQNQ